ncbi:MAG: tyrosine--tRNA ligase [bacterium]
MPVSTDEQKIQEFLTRGVEAVYPGEEELKKLLMSGQRLRVYQGFDPTGPYLHIGHAMGIRALRILQELGHEVIFLVGDFTAAIGDPDKGTTREMLGEEQIQKNMQGWKEQAGQLIDFDGENAVQFKRNSDWLGKLNLKDVLQLMSKTTVQRILERDLFDRRLKAEDPIRFHEMFYPLLQGYDGVEMKVDIEIGGADQTFNMLMGRTLSKAYLNKEKFVRVNKMMDAPEGKTMSKTKGNGINLSDSPEDMYGKAMSYPDSAILSGLELLTGVSLLEIEEIKKEMDGGANPMEFKKRMAFEIVKIIKGESSAKKGQEHFVSVIQSKDQPDEIAEIKPSAYNIVTILIESKLATSTSDARRAIKQGGVKVNDGKIDDIKFVLKPGDIVQKGKRFFVKII